MLELGTSGPRSRAAIQLLENEQTSADMFDRLYNEGLNSIPFPLLFPFSLP